MAAAVTFQCATASAFKKARRAGSVARSAHVPNRRDVLGASSSALALLVAADNAYAVQGLTAGRVPGVSPDPEMPGFQRYRRPDGKVCLLTCTEDRTFVSCGGFWESGGHGVGWSEIPHYEFRVPAGWEEVPVSIADLGGTEIDLRFRNKEEGDLSIVVAPVLRFRDVGYNARVSMEFLGPPDKIIAGFAPELFGKPLEDDSVTTTTIRKKGDQTYYEWEVKPHHLVSATATGNRVFILSTTSNSRQWRKASENLRIVQDSFFVETIA